MREKNIYLCNSDCKQCKHNRRNPTGYSEMDECTTDICPANHTKIGNIDKLNGRHIDGYGWNPLGEFCSFCTHESCEDCVKWSNRDKKLRNNVPTELRNTDSKTAPQTKKNVIDTPNEPVKQNNTNEDKEPLNVVEDDVVETTTTHSSQNEEAQQAKTIVEQEEIQKVDSGYVFDDDDEDDDNDNEEIGVNTLETENDNDDGDDTEDEINEDDTDMDMDIDFGVDCFASDDDDYTSNMFITDTDDIPPPDDYTPQEDDEDDEDEEEYYIDADYDEEAEEEFDEPEEAEFELYQQSKKLKYSMLFSKGTQIAKYQIGKMHVILSVDGDAKVTVKGKNETDGFSYCDPNRFPRYIREGILSGDIFANTSIKITDNSFYVLEFFEKKGMRIVNIGREVFDKDLSDITEDRLRRTLFNALTKKINERT